MSILVSGIGTVIDNSRNLQRGLKTINSTTLIGSGNLVAGARTILGSITTTSGSSASISGLTLTSYNKLYLELVGVSFTSSTGDLYISDGTTTVYWGDIASGAAYVLYGNAWIDLSTGFVFTESGQYASTGTYATATKLGWVGRTRYTTASTSVTVFSWGTFDAGSINVYGVR